jgi:hypothetical protein
MQPVLNRINEWQSYELQRELRAVQSPSRGRGTHFMTRYSLVGKHKLEQLLVVIIAVVKAVYRGEQKLR